VATDYTTLRARLANNKEITNEFNSNEKQITVRAENMVLLNKLRDISQGKQSSYGQHVKSMRNTFQTPGNGSFFNDISGLQGND
jgi:hypothetical protein